MWSSTFCPRLTQRKNSKSQDSFYHSKDANRLFSEEKWEKEISQKKKKEATSLHVALDTSLVFDNLPYCPALSLQY